MEKCGGIRDLSYVLDAAEVGDYSLDFVGRTFQVVCPGYYFPLSQQSATCQFG